jgi:hypothetical protein
MNNRHALAGILFLAAVGEAMQTYSTLNSSPQTTELFAAAREQTLMKWVHVGDAVALAVGLFAGFVSRSGWPVVGTVLVVGGMHYAYVNAAAAGKRETAPTANAGVKGKTKGVRRYGFAH